MPNTTTLPQSRIIKKESWGKSLNGFIDLLVPRSTVNGLGIRSFTIVYGVVYDEISRNTETVSDRIFPIYRRKWAYTGKPRYTDHDFLPYWNHKPFYQTGQETGSISNSASLPTPSIRSNSSIKIHRSKRKKTKLNKFKKILTVRWTVDSKWPKINKKN